MAKTDQPTDLRSRILNFDDTTEEVVDVPEWGVKFAVRSMTGADRAQAIATANAVDGSDNRRLWPSIIVATCHDPDTGDKVFTTGDIDALSTKRAGVLERLGLAGLRVSGLAGDDADVPAINLNDAVESAGNDYSSATPNDVDGSA